MATTIPSDRRVFRSNNAANAGILLDTQKTIVSGSRNSFVAVDNIGTYIRGPLSLITPSQEIRYAGLWVGMPDFLGMLPSNIVTLLPTRVPSPPVAALHNIKNTALSLGSFLAV